MNNILNFSNNKIIASVIGKYNTNSISKVPNFKGQLHKDCFEKQEYSFENIPQRAIELATNLNAEDKKLYFDILDAISKSRNIKNSEKTTVDSYFYQDLKENIFENEQNSEKLNEYYSKLNKQNKAQLVKNLLAIKDFPNQDIAYTINQKFLSKDEVQAKSIIAKYLVSNNAIASQDYSLIMGKTDSTKTCELQKQAINKFLENENYDGDFIPYLIENIKNTEDIDKKISSYDDFKSLPYEIKNVFMNELKDVDAKSTTKAIRIISKDNPEALLEDTSVDLSTNIKMLCDFVDFYGCKDTNSLSTVQKEKFLNSLIKNSININNFHYKNNIEILPDTDEDFISITRKLYSDVNSDRSTDIDNNAYITINRLNENQDYKNLDEKSKKIIDTAATIASFDNSTRKLKDLKKTLNINNDDFKMILSILKNKDFIDQDVEKFGLYYAYSLRDDNTFKLTSILSKSLSNITENEAAERINYIDKIRKELEKTDFVLPQISKEDILSAAKPTQIGDKMFLVASSNDIKNFAAFIHATDTNLFAACDNPEKKLDIVKTFDTPDSEEIISCSYIDGNKMGIAGDTGAIIEATPYNTILANSYDLHSPRFPNLKDAALDYLKTEDTLRHRCFVSNEIKKQLHNNEDYTKLVKSIITASNAKGINDSKLEKLSPTYYEATKKFLNTENEDFEKTFMKDYGTFNEILIKQPKIQALYTTSLDLLDKSQLDFAKYNDLPIVLLQG